VSLPCTRGAARRKDDSMYTRFPPAIIRDALKKISGEVRGWRLHRKVNYTFAGLAAMINPVVAGWMRYYGRFRRSAMYPLLRASTPTWCDGSARNTGDSRAPTRPTASCGRSPSGIPACSRTGDRHSLDVTRVTRAV
jgi:group II intron maturase